ncbi:MAG TPA: HD domain-containing protein [Clostridia bacterium]|nr:HD domain-containing protein [Clostridia bacterium]HQA97640.1 HD domain-containing protein [Clostridia bacterium]HUM61819.1 HD domain-containing protein [Clostridia bacterium]
MTQTKLDRLIKDERFEGFLIVRSASKRTNKNGDPYLDINLADNTMEINAKVWNSDEAAPDAGTVLKVRALVTEYNGRLQLRIERMRPSAANDAVDLSQLVAAAPRPADEMYSELLAVIEGMQNQVLKDITGELVRRAADKILYYPAAMSMHHAQRSGLLHHLTDMLKAAKAICDCYPYLDTDLVTAGVIVHDLGKLNEMNANELGAVSEYTREGLLLGHIVTGVADVREAAKALGYGVDDEYPLLLAHMILSHHGIPEYGSPRPPMFPEAEVLNWLDVLDSRLNEMREAQTRTRQGAFSERVFALDRRVYHPVYLNEEDIKTQSDKPPFEEDESNDEPQQQQSFSRRYEDDERAYNRFL